MNKLIMNSFEIKTPTNEKMYMNLYNLIHSMDYAKDLYWENQTDFTEIGEASITPEAHEEAFNDACITLVDEIISELPSTIELLPQRLATAYGKSLRVNMLKKTLLT